MVNIEVKYNTNSNELVAFALEGEKSNFVLEENEAVKIIKVSKYPFDNLKEIESELNAKGIVLKTKFSGQDRRYYTKEEIDAKL